MSIYYISYQVQGQFKNAFITAHSQAAALNAIYAAHRGHNVTIITSECVGPA